MSLLPEERRKEARRASDKEKRETSDALRKSLRRLVLSTTLLYLVIVFSGTKIYVDGRTTTKALCTFRADLAQRVVASTDFLKTHPNGLAGIPAQSILDSISNQQKTIRSLKDLDCPPVP